jgi:hypothetical protein
MLIHASRSSVYELIAASTKAALVDTTTLIITAQNSRSSAARAARFRRSAIGRRKMMAPGRYPMARRMAMVFIRGRR